jgi:hypothetical protein
MMEKSIDIHGKRSKYKIYILMIDAFFCFQTIQKHEKLLKNAGETHRYPW